MSWSYARAAVRFSRPAGLLPRWQELNAEHEIAKMLSRMDAKSAVWMFVSTLWSDVSHAAAASAATTATARRRVGAMRSLYQWKPTEVENCCASTELVNFGGT